MRGTWTTTSGGSDGGGLLLAVIVAAVLIGSGAATAAVSAVVTIAIIIACAMALAVIGGIGFLIWRARQDQRSRVFTAQAVSSDRRPPSSALEASRAFPAAIEPARHLHIHLDGADPAVVAALIRNLNGQAGEPRPPS